MRVGSIKRCRFDYESNKIVVTRLDYTQNLLDVLDRSAELLIV